ncbi:MAG: class I SAM-dependent methyltransferase [Solirubrobacteraceae bacterium]
MSAAPTAVTPTAHYTGYVWARNGLSHPELASAEGRLLYESLRAPMIASRLLGGPTLEAYLLARHGAIDALLERAIEGGGVTQVIEVAAGLSPRGWRFSRRHGAGLTYVEADLPAMAERKRSALQRMGSLGEHHRVEPLDALRDGGPASLAAVTAELDPTEALAIITEGLLGYLDRDSVLELWRRFARELSAFRSGFYLSDLHLGSTEARAEVRAFRLLLSAFVRGRGHLHFGTEHEAAAALRDAGFRRAGLSRASEVAPEGDSLGPGAGLANVVEATT